MTSVILALILLSALPLNSCVRISDVVGISSRQNDTSNGYKTIDEFYRSNNEVIRKAKQDLWRAAGKNPEIARSAYRWMNVASNLDANTTTVARTTSQKPLVDNPCAWDLLDFATSVDKMWALQMIDAFGKPQSGLLRAETKWVGAYDECLSVSAPPSKISTGFSGRYAWLSFKSNNTNNSAIQQLIASVTIGACLPSSCAQSNNLHQFYGNLISVLEKIPFVSTIVESLPTINVAFVPEHYPLSSASIVCICICVIFVFLVFLGTLVELLKMYYVTPQGKPEECCVPGTSNSKVGEEAVAPCTTEQMHNSINISHEQEVNTADDTKLIVVTKERKWTQPCNGMLEEFFLCFSVISNAKAILNTSTGQEQLTCLHGIRFLSMAWVILGHSYFFGMSLFGNILDMVDTINTWPFQLILQATYSVDTFFLLSGCLLTYLFLKNQDKFQGFKHWVYFYIHRYIRLTPVYAMVLFVYATWFSNLSKGPFWSTYASTQCDKTWWWNLLYINNFISATDMCLSWSWYLANDMQFFVISPLFLIGFQKKRIIGLVVVLVLLLASWISTGVITRINDFGGLFQDPTSLFQQTQTLDTFDILYDKPWTRIGPYLIGALLGVALKEVQGNSNFLNKYVVLLGWVASQTLSLVLLYGLVNNTMGPITQSAFNTLSRSAWVISVSWVVFACLTGHAGPINTLLSWKVFVPLSRLTYCAYLVHPMIMIWYYNSMKTTLMFSHSMVTLYYLGFIMLAYGLAFITSLVFEAPIMKLEKFVKKL